RRITPGPRLLPAVHTFSAERIGAQDPRRLPEPAGIRADPHPGAVRETDVEVRAQQRRIAETLPRTVHQVTAVVTVAEQDREAVRVRTQQRGDIQRDATD